MHTTATTRFDAIVVGVGGMGSAALYHLARRHRRVLGLERFDIPHSMGSSHGVNRIIRLAYFEHPTYVPLLRRAYALWRALEREANEQLLYVTGSIDAGRPGSQVLEGSLRSCRAHDLPHEVLPAAEIHRRYPGMRLPDGFQAVLQPDGGFVLSERAIVAHVTAALRDGATVHAREAMVGWEPIGDGVRVTTDRETYEARRLVLSTGAWMQDHVPPLAGHAVPERQVLGWFQPRIPDRYALDAFPVFNLTVDEGHFYGFPVFGVPGFKIGRYHHREEVVVPDSMDREPNREDERLLRDAVSRYFPDADGPTMALKTCLFTNTADEHFVIDTLPDHPQVAVAGGFSGHGFKFATVVGEVLADLVDREKTDLDIGKFSLTRFTTTD